MKYLLYTFVALSITVLPASPVSYRKHNAILKKANRAYRAITSSRNGWQILGRSNWKKKIYYRTFGSGKKTTMIIGGLHGDEPVSVIAALKLAGYIKKNPHSIHNRVVIIPCINPDGLSMGRRTNGRKVDLNRNFPSPTWSGDYEKIYNKPGKLPASEPETILIANAIDRYRPDLVIQLHQPFNAIYPKDNVPEKLLKRMSEISGLPILEDIGYPTPGSLGSFESSLEHKIQGITYELCPIDREPDYTKVTESIIEAINY